MAGRTDAIDYATPGPLTDLGSVSPSALERIPSGPVGICRPVPGLVIQPDEAELLGVPPERLAENQVRPAGRLIGALLRYRGIAARARCGFATYFQPGQGLDHWITEYWHDQDGRWVRIDSEILDQPVLAVPEDLDASYQGRTGPDYDELLDLIAAACAAGDPAAIADLYDRDELRVPAELIC